MLTSIYLLLHGCILLQMDNTYGVSHLLQTACVCNKKRLLPNSKAVCCKVMKFPLTGENNVVWSRL